MTMESTLTQTQTQSRDHDPERGAHHSRDRTDGSRQTRAARAVSAVSAVSAAGGVGGARILRRWSVADLIARAGGAPRAFA